jgi:hypothetical protein
MHVEDPPEPLLDTIAIRIFLLCDYASVPPDNKVYMNGGGIHQVLAAQLPGSIRSLYLMVRLSIPWHMLGEPHTVKIRALDLDRHPVTPNDPLLTTPFELGRPPGHRPGDESAINICAELSGLSIQRPMTIRFHLLVDDETLGSLPLKVSQLP